MAKLSIQFGNRKLESVRELVESINESWDLAALLLENGTIGRALADDKYYAEKVAIIEKFNNIDLALFTLQYVLQPDLPFRYKGYEVDELTKIGNEILSRCPYVEFLFEEMLSKRIFSSFILLKGLTESNPDTYNKLVEVEKEYLNNRYFSYYKLGYLLSDNKGFRYSGREFADQLAFFKFIESKKRLQDFVSHKEYEQYLLAWLAIQGHEESVNLWRERVVKLESWK